MTLRIRLAVLAAFAWSCGCACAEPLVLEEIIALPDTSGRIDHMAIDLARKRLFVAELGNASVDVVDLASRKIVHRLSNLDEPQGIAYAAKTDLLAVANGGDGTLRLYAGASYVPRSVIALGDDADNMRPGPGEGQVTVGYGGGALTIVDTATARKVAESPLAAHPEAFVLAPDLNRAFVNVPDARQIAVLDLRQMKQVASWSVPGLTSNFPMVLGFADSIAVVFRGQSKVVVLDGSSGRIVAEAGVCGDADDIYFDARRGRFYVSCGDGFVDVFESRGLTRIGHVASAWGARTSLFVPELDRLYVAARAGLFFGSNGAIRVYRPAN